MDLAGARGADAFDNETYEEGGEAGAAAAATLPGARAVLLVRSGVPARDVCDGNVLALRVPRLQERAGQVPSLRPEGGDGLRSDCEAGEWGRDAGGDVP